jgi:glycosyltransferase involved in cell wall biosynthesis
LKNVYIQRHVIAELNYISVIVTAFDRQEYLPFALDSLVHQSESNFETILITNFDFDLSEYSSLDIKFFVMGGEAGAYYYKGIKESTGNIIALLDDDDWFAKEKIRTLYEVFEKRVDFYHNATYLVRDSVVTSRIFGRYIVDFNTSSMAVRKDLVLPYVEVLRKLRKGQDHFFYFAVLDSKGKIKEAKEILTYYRIHGNNTTGIQGTLSVEWLRAYIAQLREWQEVFTHPKCQASIRNHTKDAEGFLFIRSNGTLTVSDFIRTSLSYFTQLEYQSLKSLILIALRRSVQLKKFPFQHK